MPSNAGETNLILFGALWLLGALLSQWLMGRVVKTEIGMRRLGAVAVFLVSAYVYTFLIQYFFGEAYIRWWMLNPFVLGVIAAVSSKRKRPVSQA